MKKILDFTIFSISKQYYFKQFFWGFLPLFFMVVMSPSTPLSFYFIFGFILLFYPYTKMAWDYLMNLLLSDGPILILPVAVLFIWYLVRTFFLFFLTPFLCPFILGFLYWYNRRHEIENFNG